RARRDRTDGQEPLARRQAAAAGTTGTPGGVTMSRQERIDERLARWEELREQGQEPTAEELAADAPALRGELTKAIRRLKAMDWLDSPADPDAPAPQSRNELAGRVPPTLAGRYRMEHVLAEGGFSQVWRAVDTSLQRPVAGKGTPLHCRAEARRVAPLPRPRIVSGPDARPHAGPCFIL